MLFHQIFSSFLKKTSANHNSYKIYTPLQIPDVHWLICICYRNRKKSLLIWAWDKKTGFRIWNGHSIFELGTVNRLKLLKTIYVTKNVEGGLKSAWGLDSNLMILSLTIIPVTSDKVNCHYFCVYPKIYLHKMPLNITTLFK